MQRSLTELRALLEAGVSALGFELVALELKGRGHHAMLRVYIDSPNGVTVDDCADVSHQLSAILDVEDPIVGSYTLEVSSPGLDRPLEKREHFERVIGQQVKLTLYRPQDGRRNYQGRLCALAGEHILVEVDGAQFELPLNEIEKARLVPKI